MATNEFAIIAGFGLPGRAVAEALDRRGVPFVVVELNAATVVRCGKGGVPIIAGDVIDPEVLKKAGIERATMFIIAVPGEAVALKAVAVGRSLNKTCKIIARLAYLSSGIKARAAGADEVVVAEQVVAAEFARVLGAEIGGG